jgi:membrane fusion protein, multidrug efflux system
MMNKRRTLVSVIVLVSAALAIIVLLKIVGSKAGEEGGESVTDVAVHIGKIARATLHRNVTAYGVVEPEPASPGRQPADSEVASPVAGIVAHIDCVEGQQVAKGTVLFRLDSRVADVAYDKAKKTLAFAEENFDRQKKLLPVEGTSKKAYLEAEQQLNSARSELAAAETDLSLLRIEAPLAGTVVKINAEPGEAVELNSVLAKIVDLGRLILAASVPSREAQLVKVGQPAEFETGSPAAQGVVIYVGSQVDDKTDTIPVRISASDKNSLQLGKFTGVRIICEERRDRLAVPEESLVSSAEEGSWIVLVQGDKAVRKSVKTGLREAGLIEIEGEGLTEGMIIVTEDAYSLPKETKIHLVGK